MRVLVVDDSNAFRRFVRNLISTVADAIDECGDGAEVLSVYNRHRPDIVLMDIQMGPSNGLLATRQITAAHAAAKVVIVTDYDDDDFRQAAMRAGACAYMLKDNLTNLPGLLLSLIGSD